MLGNVEEEEETGKKQICSNVMRNVGSMYSNDHRTRGGGGGIPCPSWIESEEGSQLKKKVKENLK